MAGKNSPNISAGGDVTIGHIGDVINQAPRPELKLGPSRSQKNADGTFTITVDAEVVSPYPPGSLLLEAWASEIISFEAVPQRTGLLMLGHSGQRPDHAFTTIIQPFGTYKITAITRVAASIELRYAFDK